MKNLLTMALLFLAFGCNYPIRCHDARPTILFGAGGVYAACGGACWEPKQMERFRERGVRCLCSPECPCWHEHEKTIFVLPGEEDR